MTPSDSILPTGEVRLADVQRARREVKSLTSKKRLLRSQISWRVLNLCRLAAQIWILRIVLTLRRLSDLSVTRVGVVCIGSTFVVGLFIAVAYDPAAGLARYSLMGCIGAFFAAAVFLPAFFLKEDSSLYASAYSIALRRSEIAEERKHFTLQFRHNQAQLRSAQAEYNRLNRIINSRLYKLRACRWDLKTGTDFERFLSEVFQERGYIVELTGKSGDQGVDLVITRDGIRIAIQAKGYLSNSVGNSAVQEAHTGMAFYRCQMSAVVTNARFTASARELAQSVGCRLIDGGQIPGLISGRISL
jgi:HJR/Mrr/RecB family endonuclease